MFERLPSFLDRKEGCDQLTLRDFFSSMNIFMVSLKRPYIS